MKIRYLYLNIFFAVVYSALSLLNAQSITTGYIVKTLMLSLAVIFVGYILDSKSIASQKKSHS